ncbi:MAG: hypothetical protein HY261_07005, partial [Chloroflexi bacterium]|nr:hypothetical protein [Chloroflexota bacterium]
MFSPVRFPNDVEELVRFVEETPTGEIIPATLAKLRAGLEPKSLLRAGALAVTRSTELPGHHHGGPIHPVSGTYPVYHTSRMLSGETAFLPIIQHTALCNLHVHEPDMGPYIMPEIEPLGAGDNSAKAVREAFDRQMRMRHRSAIEKHLLWFLENLPQDEVLDIILSKAVTRNPEDDHYFLYPSFTSRALDLIGWEWAKYLLRPTVTYLSQGTFYTGANAPPFANIEALLTQYKLLEMPVKQHTSAAETQAVGALAERAGNTNAYAEIPVMVAEAIAGGLSIEGAGEAMSIGASVIHLRTSYGNPMDVHLHTGINVRRYLLKKPGISTRTKLLLLLTWHSGPEVRLSEKKMEWSAKVESERMAKLPARSQPEL